MISSQKLWCYTVVFFMNVLVFCIVAGLAHLMGGVVGNLFALVGGIVSGWQLCTDINRISEEVG